MTKDDYKSAAEYVHCLEKENKSAAECIKEILESYMEVLDLFQKTMEQDIISSRIKIMALTLCKERKEKWGKFLKEVKKTIGC